mmetsp:Transcript_2240/g.7098  ORF Transcript_2240/g.7098 Transcript_2240/m.7098 type:complete len:257 (+) Transcript_2240:150-920(+)
MRPSGLAPTKLSITPSLPSDVIRTPSSSLPLTLIRASESTARRRRWLQRSRRSWRLLRPFPTRTPPCPNRRPARLKHRRAAALVSPRLARPASVAAAAPPGHPSGLPHRPASRAARAAPRPGRHRLRAAAPAVPAVTTAAAAPAEAAPAAAGTTFSRPWGPHLSAFPRALPARAPAPTASPSRRHVVRPRLTRRNQPQTRARRRPLHRRTTRKISGFGQLQPRRGEPPRRPVPARVSTALAPPRPRRNVPSPLAAR